MTVKGMSLLTPKSVNDTLNTKVQRCGRHQVNPMGGEDEAEKSDGKGRKQE
jgi:hypothetical protein